MSEETKKKDTWGGEWMIGKAQKATCTSHRDEKFQQLHKIAVGKKKVCKKISSHSSILLPSLTLLSISFLLPTSFQSLLCTCIHIPPTPPRSSSFLPPSLHFSPLTSPHLLQPFFSSSVQHLFGRTGPGLGCCCWPGLLAAE